MMFSRLGDHIHGQLSIFSTYGGFIWTWPQRKPRSIYNHVGDCGSQKAREPEASIQLDSRSLNFPWTGGCWKSEVFRGIDFNTNYLQLSDLHFVSSSIKPREHFLGSFLSIAIGGDVSPNKKVSLKTSKWQGKLLVLFLEK